MTHRNGKDGQNLAASGHWSWEEIIDEDFFLLGIRGRVSGDEGTKEMFYPL